MSGLASLSLCGLTLTVSGYQFPDDESEWDGNWLVAKAEMIANGCRVVQSGAFVRTSELHRFEEELASLLGLEAQTANLACMEPNLDIRLTRDGGLGAVSVRVFLTPDTVSQAHRVDYATSLGDLGAVLASLKQMNRRFPVKGCG